MRNYSAGHEHIINAPPYKNPRVGILDLAPARVQLYVCQGSIASDSSTGNLIEILDTAGVIAKVDITLCNGHKLDPQTSLQSIAWKLAPLVFTEICGVIN